MRSARKIIGTAFVFAILASGCLFGQLDFYKVPKLSSSSGDRNASIASNSLGDIMVIYTNSVVGATYTYRAHGGTTWSAPQAVPNQNYSSFIKSILYWTDITSSSDNLFHAIWAVDSHQSVGYGMYYATFNPSTSQWSAPELLLGGRVGEPKLITNQYNGDLILTWDWYLESGTTKNKDVFIKVKKTSGWQPEVNVSQQVIDSSNITNAPHGQLAETNANVAVDESDGYVYLTWKEDQYVDELEAQGEEPWQLRIHVVLFDPTYKMVWNEQVTKNYLGFQFLPSIAALNGQAIMMCAWPTEGTYNYIVFTREGDKLTYDSHVFEDNWMATVPNLVNRWYAWHNHMLTHGDEIIGTYADDGLYVTMRRMKDWLWQTGPIDLSHGERELYYPFDSFSDPRIGILSSFHNYHDGEDEDDRESKAEICISIYNYPATLFYSAVNVTVIPQTEHTLFKSVKFNQIVWKNHPLNISRKVVISKWRVYRKLKTEKASSYLKIGEVDGDVFVYNDRAPNTGLNVYDYFVTAVDDKGNESQLPKN